MQINAVARNLVANNRELERLVRTFAKNRDVNGGALWAFEQVRDIAGIHVVRRLTIDSNDNVSRMNSRPVGRRSSKWRNDYDLVVAWADSHSDAVVFSALIFPQ